MSAAGFGTASRPVTTSTSRPLARTRGTRIGRYSGSAAGGKRGRGSIQGLAGRVGRRVDPRFRRVAGSGWKIVPVGSVWYRRMVGCQDGGLRDGYCTRWVCGTEWWLGVRTEACMVDICMRGFLGFEAESQGRGIEYGKALAKCYFERGERLVTREDGGAESDIGGTRVCRRRTFPSSFGSTFLETEARVQCGGACAFRRTLSCHAMRLRPCFASCPILSLSKGGPRGARRGGRGGGARRRRGPPPRAPPLAEMCE